MHYIYFILSYTSTILYKKEYKRTGTEAKGNNLKWIVLIQYLTDWRTCREEVCCPTAHHWTPSTEGKLCCRGEQHNASCCVLCPVCAVYVPLSRWWQGHKSQVGLRRLNLLSSFRRAAILYRASFFLCRGTPAYVALDIRQCHHNAVAGPGEANSLL